MKRGILILSVSILVALGVWIFGCHYGAREELLARADRIQSWLEQLDPSRSVLWGESVPGNAWDDYSRAIASIAEGEDEAALALMQSGAHRQRAVFPIDWAQGFINASYTSLLTSRSLINMSVKQSEQLLDEDQPTRAVELLLDAMQFGRDTMQVPRVIDEMIGAALIGIVARDALVRKGILERIPDQQLQFLSEGMARLDADLLASSHSFHGDLALFLRTITSIEGMDLGTTSGSWAYGFSYLRMAVDYADVFEAMADERLETADMPWDQQRRRMGVLQQAAAESRNPMAKQLVNVSSAMSTRLSAIKMLRMTRMAVMHRLGLELEPLPDPFGDRLSFDLQADKLVIWSQGQGGRPLPHDRIEIASKPAAPSGR